MICRVVSQSNLPWQSSPFYVTYKLWFVQIAAAHLFTLYQAMGHLLTLIYLSFIYLLFSAPSQISADRSCPRDLCVCKMLRAVVCCRVIKSPMRSGVITLTPSNDNLIYTNTTLNRGEAWGGHPLHTSQTSGDWETGRLHLIIKYCSVIGWIPLKCSWWWGEVLMHRTPYMMWSSNNNGEKVTTSHKTSNKLRAEELTRHLASSCWLHLVAVMNLHQIVLSSLLSLQGWFWFSSGRLHSPLFCSSRISSILGEI